MADLVALIAKLDGIGEQPAAFDLYVIRQACREAADALKQRALVPLPEVLSIADRDALIGALRAARCDREGDDLWWAQARAALGFFRARYGQPADARCQRLVKASLALHESNIQSPAYQTIVVEFIAACQAVRDAKRADVPSGPPPTPSPARPKLLAYRAADGLVFLRCSDAEWTVSAAAALMGEVPLIEGDR